MRDERTPLRPPTDTTSRCSSDSHPISDADAALSRSGDEHIREGLTTPSDQSLPALASVDRSSVSRPTVYRRFDRLEEAGPAETTMSFHPDGHHRKEFRIVVRGIELRPGDDIRAACTDGPTAHGSEDPHPVHASD